MDWIASALNESVHTIVPPHMSSKDDLGDLSTPNFDRFLSISSGDKEKTKKEQHQNNKPSVPNPTSSTNNLTAPSVNKVNFSPSTGLSYPPPPNHHNDITSGSQARGPHPFDSVHHNPDLQPRL